MEYPLKPQDSHYLGDLGRRLTHAANVPISTQIGVCTFSSNEDLDFFLATGKTMGSMLIPTTPYGFLCFAKIESALIKPSRLRHEYDIYSMLKTQEKIPRIFLFHEDPDLVCLVMEILWVNVKEVFDCGWFVLRQDIAATVIEMLDCLELLHQKGYVHGDVKPDNFCYTFKRGCGITLYMIDFENSHPFPYEGSFKGTVKWASSHSLLGEPMTRRDDMHSLAYILVFLSTGTLPFEQELWTCNSWVQVGELKRSLSVERLCYGLPACCHLFISHCFSLGVEDVPEYEYLKQSLMKLL